MSHKLITVRSSNGYQQYKWYPSGALFGADKRFMSWSTWRVGSARTLSDAIEIAKSDFGGSRQTTYVEELDGDA